MRITYAPDGGVRQEFKFDVDGLSATEAETLEEVGGQSWDTLMEWYDKFERGSFKAWRAVLWVYLRRTDPTLSFDLFLPVVSEIEIEQEDTPAVVEGKGEGEGEPTDSPSPEPATEPSPSN